MSDDSVKLYAHVGLALTTWSGVEFALCRVYSQAMSPETVHPGFGSHRSARTFWAVHSVESRVQISDATCEAAYGPYHLFEDWKRLRNKIRKNNELRNKIAHGSVQITTETSANGVIATFQPFPRTRTDGKWLIRSGEGELPPMSVDDLAKVAIRFSDLTQELLDFTKEVFAFYHPNADFNTWPIGAEAK